jgi:hypothetical protein
MSGAVVGGSAGAIAAAAAAKKAAQLRDEEERLTSYNQNDLEGWEFKIVRSATGKFKKYDFVKKICDEEAKAGWEMVEKFDDNRIRFKRQIDKRSMDRHLDIDPYRTSIGLSGDALGLTIAGVILLVIGVVLAVVFYLKG